jgi:hypothetical protein
LFIVVSCDESFEPKATFDEKVVLECIIECSLQNSAIVGTAVALVSKTYNVAGTNPAVNIEDPAIKGAHVVLIVGSDTVAFQESSIARTDTSRYHSRQTLYFCQRGFQSGDLVHLIATLPDGRVLRSQTTIPQFKRLESTPPFRQGVTTIPKAYGTNWVLNWDDFSGGEHLFFPSLKIQYTLVADTLKVDRFFPVPLRLVARDGTLLPVYPSYQTEKQCSFEFAAMDAAMANLSASDPIKQNYKIRGFLFNILEYDFALSRYYSSTNGYLDQFSLRLDQSVYSNIAGGLGIFGTSLRTPLLFPVNGLYAMQFGYTWN